ncbi:MAG TPA: phospholipid carrier-dependent glycosyltransferase [Gaiellales bacterium]|nr:phospholipid carrier-dependent glycosyltransferase [Gaiellales bacterium]
MSAAGRAGAFVRGTAALAGRHRLFCALLAAALAIRAVVWLAYQPALFFYGDSYTYLGNSTGLRPNPIRPIGYPLLLHVLLLGNTIAAAPAAQHLFGLVTAVICYAVLRRFGAGPVLASVAVVPVLFDGYLIDIEQYVLAESMFMLLVVSGLALLVWRNRPSVAACAAAGALLGAASLTRTVGMVLIVPALLYLVLRWAGGLRIAALAVAFAVPILAYAAWFDATWGQFTVTKHDGYFLYGRVSTFATCGSYVPASQRWLCFGGDPGHRENPNFYVWHKWATPRYRHHPFALDGELRSFALSAIEHQPLAYARTVAGDLEHYASAGHWTSKLDTPFWHWRFPTKVEAPHLLQTERAVQAHGGHLAIDSALAGPLRSYQRIVFLPGTVMALMVLAGFAATAIGRREGDRRLRAEALLFTLTALALPATAAATTMFDYRYVLPAIPPLCVAAGVAGLVTADLVRARSGSLVAGNEARPPAEPVVAHAAGTMPPSG